MDIRCTAVGNGV